MAVLVVKAGDFLPADLGACPATNAMARLVPSLPVMARLVPATYVLSAAGVRWRRVDARNKSAQDDGGADNASPWSARRSRS